MKKQQSRAQQQELLSSGKLALECMTCRLLGCLCMHVNVPIYFLKLLYTSPYAEMCSSEQALESAPDNDAEFENQENELKANEHLFYIIFLEPFSQ